MEKIPYDVILEVQRKVNIVDVISEYLPIEQKGKNYFAICPFHDDHNPSMSISPEKQIYTCFVCGASGNVINFVMNYEKISFAEAVAKLAVKAGVTLNVKYEGKKNVLDDKYEKFYKMFDVTNKYYQNNLRSLYGKKATEYLHKRNIDDEAIKTFEIGLSLNDNNVSKLLEAKGYQVDELTNIGLCGSKGNFVYDTFRNRIMFPLWNSTGQVVGFSGRIYNGENESKYTNSKESVIFKKGSLLYNYHRAMEYAREKRQIIIVEGFMDVIRLYTIGIKNVVATMGTAITKEHADLIRRLSKNVVLCFDGDGAGEKATVSALAVLEKIGLTPKVIRLEEGYDPDDYVVKKGNEAFLNHLKNLMNAFEFKLTVNKKQTNFNDYNEVSNYLKEAAKELEQINDKVVYELTVKRLAKETGVDEKTINSLVSNVPKQTPKLVDKPRMVSKNKYVKAEEYLIYYMLRNVDAVLIYQNNVSYLPNQKLSLIAMEILSFYEKNHYVNLTDFTLFLEDKEDLINEVLRIDAYDLPPTMTTEQIKDYVKTIDEGILNQEITKLKNQISKETSVATKVVLLEKLASLKKKECIR
ncbi:MAG: DNA primase [Bacilli bacterium]|nr:DNA primase [Bacilli bacterium]